MAVEDVTSRSAEGVRVEADTPALVDRLNRRQAVTALADVIRRADTPLVMALYGTWGSGKTSLMKQIRAEIDPGSLTADERSELGLPPPPPGGGTIRTVWFDPWAHQRDDDPVLGLLHATTQQLGITTEQSVKQALMKIAEALTEDVQVPVAGVRVGKLWSLRRQLADQRFERRSESAQLRDHFETVVRRAREADADQPSDRGGKRLVFFIDDLDRCQPRVALALLESLKLYLDMPGCVYVLGVDREPLEAAVADQYANLGLRAESYLDKIIQLPFVIPAIDGQGMRDLVASIVPDELDGCRPILVEAAADIPRDVKRLANALSVSHALAREGLGDEYEPRYLAIVTVIQSLNPDLYRRMRVEAGLLHEVVAGDPMNHDGESDPALWNRFVEESSRLERALRALDLDPDANLEPYVTLTADSSITVAPSQVETKAGASRRPDTRLQPDEPLPPRPRGVAYVSASPPQLVDERGAAIGFLASSGWLVSDPTASAPVGPEPSRTKLRRELAGTDLFILFLDGAELSALHRMEIDVARQLDLEKVAFVRWEGSADEFNSSDLVAQLTNFWIYRFSSRAEMFANLALLLERVSS